MVASRSRRNALLVIVAALAVGGAALGMCAFIHHRQQTVGGKPIGEAIFADTVVVVDDVTLGGGNSGMRPSQSSSVKTTGTRLTSVDTKTGEQLALEVTEYQSCWAAGARLWCQGTGGIDALDPRTLAVAANTTTLIATAKLAKPTRDYHVDKADLVVHLSDGRGARISPELAVSSVDSTDWTQAARVGHVDGTASCPTTSYAEVGEARFKLADEGSRTRLISDGARGSLTFLEGRFLELAPALPLVLYQEQVDGPQSIARVERVAQRWSVSLEGKCRAAHASGGALLVITSNPARRVIAADLASGATLWVFGR